VLYVTDDDDNDTQGLKNKDFHKPIPIFATLAKLLMEIEYGVCLKDTSTEDLLLKIKQGVGQNWTEENTLEGDREIETLKDVSRMRYLQAVQFLLALNTLYKNERKLHLEDEPIELVKSIIRNKVANALAGIVPGNGCPTVPFSRESLSNSIPQSSFITLFDDKDSA
jgi:hypothetical protein